MEVIGRKQFLNSLPTEKQLHVLEKKHTTCVQAGELADEYEQARRQDSNQTLKKSQVKCYYCGKAGHDERECQKKKQENESANTGGTIQCYNFRKFGHVARQSPGVAALECHSGKNLQSLQRKGQMEGRSVNDILLDTGCSRTMVWLHLVPERCLKEGRAVTIRCAHGDTALYPVAQVNLEVGGKHV